LRNPGEGGTHKYKDRTLNASAYKNLINSYLSNINTTIPVEEETPIIDQWKKCNTTNAVEQNEETDISHEKAEEDMLWKELEVGLASVYFDDSEVKACLAIVFAFLFLLRFVLFFFLRLIISSII
jgi:DNA repair and recombination RAD54-like protein